MRESKAICLGSCCVGSRPGPRLAREGPGGTQGPGERHSEVREVRGSLLRRNWGNRFERGNGRRREEICRLGWR